MCWRELTHAHRAAAGPDAGKVAQLTAMGFTAGQAAAGLAATGGHVENACAWILDHPAAGLAPAPAAGPDAPAGEGDSAPHVHQANCDRCKKQIVGTRYKCRLCPDFDLCPACYPMRVMWHDEEHEFAAHTTELAVSEGGGGGGGRVLSDEEKKAEVARLKELMEHKRQLREEDAARAARESEMKVREEEIERERERLCL